MKRQATLKALPPHLRPRALSYLSSNISVHRCCAVSVLELRSGLDFGVETQLSWPAVFRRSR